MVGLDQEIGDIVVDSTGSERNFDGGFLRSQSDDCLEGPNQLMRKAVADFEELQRDSACGSYRSQINLDLGGLIICGDVYCRCSVEW